MLTFIIGSAACATFKFPPELAVKEITSFARPDFPSFAGTGSFRVYGADRPFSGAILLALEKDRFRLEIISKTGAVILAAAGTPDRIIQIDPATGKRKVLNGDPVVISDGFTAPAIFLRSMVTGSAPKFDGVMSTSFGDGVRIVKVDSPRMDFFYTEKLNKIIHHPPGGPAVNLSLGAMIEGPLAPYVSSAEVSYRNLQIVVQWEEVSQGLNFPEGFFEFNEPI